MNQSAWVSTIGPVGGNRVTKYYNLGAQRVAMRKGNVVYFLHGDHLGSTSLTTDASGGLVSQARYLPYGETRSGSTGPTDFGFTGQRQEARFGLMDYKARYYSPVLGRFISPDSIVPDPTKPQIFNRYTYVGNNPLRNTDPDGHCYPVCTAAIGVLAGGIIGVTLYTVNVARSGQEWNWSDAGVATLGGAIAGGLIGTGVGVAALGASAATAAAITGAGAGMAGAGAGYLGGNIVTGAEFNSVDFAITSGIGTGAGTIAPFVATGVGSAMTLNAAANALEYEVTNYVHNGSLTPDAGLAWSVGAGAIGGAVGGPATAPNKLTYHAPTDEFVSKYSKYAPHGLGWDPVKFPDQVANDLLIESIGTANVVRTGLDETVNAIPCPLEQCK